MAAACWGQATRARASARPAPGPPRPPAPRGCHGRGADLGLGRAHSCAQRSHEHGAVGRAVRTRERGRGGAGPQEPVQRVQQRRRLCLLPGVEAARARWGASAEGGSVLCAKSQLRLRFFLSTTAVQLGSGAGPPLRRAPCQALQRRRVPRERRAGAGACAGGTLCRGCRAAAG